MTAMIYKFCFSHMEMHFILLDIVKIQVHNSLINASSSENYTKMAL